MHHVHAVRSCAWAWIAHGAHHRRAPAGITGWTMVWCADLQDADVDGGRSFSLSV